MSKKTIIDYEGCPHCGSDYGYYQTCRISGTIQSQFSFTGKEMDNGEMYDTIRHANYSKYYYCIECHKRICLSENEGI